MQYQDINAGYGYILKLDRGELLRETVLRFAEKEDIKSAYLFAIGAVEDARIGYYDLENKKYVFSKYPGIYELASLQGNISVYEGKQSLHMHAVLSEAGVGREILAGHLDEARVAVTAEIFIHLLHGVKLRRALDLETGLPLLQLEN
jgi:uncharacterized protein